MLDALTTVALVCSVGTVLVSVAVHHLRQTQSTEVPTWKQTQRARGVLSIHLAGHHGHCCRVVGGGGSRGDITLQSFSRRFYPKRLTISEFNIGSVRTTQEWIE